VGKRDTRDTRTKAADIQIANLLKHYSRDFRVRGDRVSMPMAMLRERLGFAYSHGELAMAARVEHALKDRS
jgi:hypothetical protein